MWRLSVGHLPPPSVESVTSICLSSQSTLCNKTDNMQYTVSLDYQLTLTDFFCGVVSEKGDQCTNPGRIIADPKRVARHLTDVQIHCPHG